MLTEVLPPDAAGTIMAALDDAATHGTHRGATYCLPVPSGAQWFELAIAPIGEPQTPDTEYVILARDVTARHEAEEALHRRVAELDVLRQMSELLVQRVDLAGALQSVSQTLLRLFDARTCQVLLATGERAEISATAAGAPEDALVGQVLTVPLTSRGETLGTLVVARDARQRAFSPDEAAVAHTAAGLLAGVIRMERLHAAEKEEAADEERRRIARDLHDSVTQSIHAANMLASTLPTSWQRSPDEARETLRTMQQSLRAAFAELRILLYELRPETLAAAPLETLLERLRDALAGRTEAVVELSIEPGLDLPQEVRLEFYRIAQEALNNVVKHARAAHVAVTVARDDGLVRLTVSDDGCGFAPDEQSPGMGRSIMQERAGSIGARLTIAGAPGAGTTVALIWSPGGTAAQRPRCR